MPRRHAIWTLLLLVIWPLAKAAPAKDEVTALPGLTSPIYFKHYSGYLNASQGKFLHYWFVQSESSPNKDPLLLWLNGGPGCSSMFGLLGEHGPIHVNKDGKTLYINPYRWNKIANVLYLEAPCGVGYSYSTTGNYTIDDNEVAEDNYLALKSFFAKFPEFRKNDFYVTGESYAGIYVPTLSLRILTGTQPINFQGFAIGNGITDFELNGKSLIFFGYYHGLFGQSMWDNLLKYCCKGIPTRDKCNFSANITGDCQQAVNNASALVLSDDLNRYNLYADCLTPTGKKMWSRTTKNSKDVYAATLVAYSLGLTKTWRPFKEVITCVDNSYISNWLNQQTVRQAIHIPDKVQKWEECSSDVAFNYKTVYNTVKPIYDKLLSSGKVRALVYNGDIDLACNFLGDQWFVESLNLPALSKYQEWHFNKQVAGYFKRFQGLSLITVRGSGHMVPQDKPGQAYKMIDQFLKGHI